MRELMDDIEQNPSRLDDLGVKNPSILADSLYRMSDGSQSLTASGAAFAAGICLAPRFSGTGYDPDGRMQGDFGSNVYFIQEVCSHEKP